MPTPDDAAEAQLAAAFARAHLAYRPDAADGWRARLQLVVTDGQDRVLHVDPDGARVERGRSLRRDARMEADSATWRALLDGSLAVDDAFQQGRLRCDVARQLLRFAASFDWKATAEAAALSAPAAPAARPSPLPPHTAGPWPVGKRYDGGHALVTAADTAAFAAVLGDDNPLYEGPGALAPPMFHARLMRDLLFLVLEDPDLDSDLQRALHAGHDVTFHTPLSVGDLVVLRGVVAAVQQKRSGRLITADFFAMVEGEVAVHARSRFYVRDRTDAAPAPGHPEKAAAPPAAASPADDILLDLPLVVGPDLARRYGEVSLDRNPLHLDDAFARAAGFPGAILQGLCTMGLAATALQQHLAEGDPRRLRRLALRWTRPVRLGQQLRLVARPDPAGACFVVLDDSGATVVDDGVAHID